MSTQRHVPSRSRLMSQWERSREEVALLMAETVSTQQRLHALIGLQDALHQELFGETAPEFELSVKAVSA